MCDTCTRVIRTWDSDVNWNQGSGGINRKFAQGITASGVNFWQYKRACQYSNLYYLREPEWNISNIKLYPIVTDLCDEYIGICRDIAAKFSPKGCNAAYDMCWSHVMQALYGSGAVVEAITRAVIARYHCCAKKNAADPNAPVYKDTPSSMEAFAADKCFKELLAACVKLELVAFDGDASTQRHFYSYYPDSRATRDPNHVAKNVYKQLIAIYCQLKYGCSCCECHVNKDGSKSRKRKHNPITKEKAKRGQVWVGKILRETKSVDEAKKKLEAYLDHLHGKCKPGGGCVHSFPHTHNSPVNCAEMETRIRDYFAKEVIGIAAKIIVDGVGAVDTNTCESVNMLCKMMRDKIRVLGAALYCVRTDIAYLMQNQICLTRHLPGARRHFLAELLQRTGHAVTPKQLDTWIREEEQKNLKDDAKRTPEQKQRRIQRKFGQPKGGSNNRTGKDCDDFYHSGSVGGKSVLLPNDLMRELEGEGEGERDVEAFPTDKDTLTQFGTAALRTIAQILIIQGGGDVEDRVKDIPTKGRGQKKAWLELCLKLVSEQNLSKVHVPVSVCSAKNRLVAAVDAHGAAVLALHPAVWNVRITFENKVCLLICFDLETTGLGIYQAQITQFGAVCALSRPGEQLELVGTYSSYVECKMRFPHDVTVLTKIKHWFHEDSPLRGAPTLAQVNAEVQEKIEGWRKV